LGQDGLDNFQKTWQILSDQVPHDLVVNRVVSMSQDVPKGHDARRVADAACCLWIGTTQPVERLADDLEVPLDSLAQEPVLEVLGKVALTGLSENERRCVSDVLQVLG
jgi:hypothetical protein